MKKHQIIILLMLFASASSFAIEVEIDGLWYEVVSKTKEAKVIQYKNGNKYSGNIVIPATVNYNNETYSVTSIAGYSNTDVAAFYNCNSLYSITIPNSVTSIGFIAFDGCVSLSSVHISDIAAWCNIDFTEAYNGNGKSTCNPLYYAHNLYLGGKKITELIIPNGVTSIGDLAFCNCSSITSVTIPKIVTSIGFSAFKGCSGLTSVHISDLVTWCKISFSEYSPLSIAHHLFINRKEITNLVIPDGVTSIGNYAFSSCSGLTSVTIPNSVTSIGSSAFSYCSGLTSVTIPNSVTFIGQTAFSGCSGLTTVTIGSGLKTIGRNAFANCPDLTDVYCYAESAPSTNVLPFYNSYIEYATLHVPYASIDAYKAVEPWKNFKTIMGLDGTIPEAKKCATPTISHVNGKLKFNCETEGVEYVSEVTVADAKKNYSSEVNLTATYHVSVYATKQGYENSDVATTTINWINQESQIHYLSFVVDNKELKKQETEVGAVITPPTTDNIGNTISWYTYPATMPAHDLIVYGMVPKPEAATKYTITYVLDGQTYRTIVVEEGEAVNKEKAPYKEGYTFNGWQNEPTTMPGRNVTVNGTFSVNTYRLSFIVDNEELSARNVTYGAAISAPTKDSEGNEVTWYSYPTTMPAHDLVVYGMTVKESEEPEPTEPEPIVPEPEVFVWLTVNDSQSGYTRIKVKQGAEQTLNFTAEEGWKISNIFMDGRYVTSRLAEDGTFVTPAITSDASIIVVYEEETPSGVRAASRSQADVKVVSDGVVISNAEPDTHCTVYQTDGKQVVNTVINEGTRKITLQKGQAYILTIDGRTLKFAL